MIGLLAGLIIGAILVYFATFRRRDDGGPSRPGRDLQVGDGILIPEQHLGWTPEREEGTDYEEEPEEEPEDETEGDDEYGDDLGEYEGDMDEPGEEYDEEYDEGDGEEEPERVEMTDEEELDDLSNEIDRLLEETSDPTDLPDPEEETVDPGARF